jgi:hypothetical protein
MGQFRSEGRDPLPDEVAAVLAALHVYVAEDVAAPKLADDPWIRASRQESVLSTRRMIDSRVSRGWRSV